MALRLRGRFGRRRGHHRLRACHAVTMVRALDPGTSFGRLVSVGSLAAGQVAALAEGMLTGLAALHSRRLVHGAIHPGNVFLDPDGSVRLSDAGLALHAYPRTQRRGDLEAVTALLLEIWEPSRRLAHPALTFLLEHDALTQASDAAGALRALHDVWPETERTAGRAGLGEFALPSTPLDCPMVTREGHVVALENGGG